MHSYAAASLLPRHNGWIVVYMSLCSSSLFLLLAGSTEPYASVAPCVLDYSGSLAGLAEPYASVGPCVLDYSGSPNSFSFALRMLDYSEKLISSSPNSFSFSAGG